MYYVAILETPFNLDWRRRTCHSLSLSLSLNNFISVFLSAQTFAMTFNYDLHLWQTMQSARSKQRRHLLTCHRNVPHAAAACWCGMPNMPQYVILICSLPGMYRTHTHTCVWYLGQKLYPHRVYSPQKVKIIMKTTSNGKGTGGKGGILTKQSLLVLVLV